MNIYITIGTLEYLKTIKNKYPSETMVMMTDENGALLLHETSSSSVFNEPRRYEAIEYKGDIKKSRIVVMNHIPVTDEGRPLFEQNCKNSVNSMGNEPGFAAVWLLRPLTTNTYVFLTAWDSILAFQGWKESDSYLMAGAEKELDPQVHIFESASYESIYTVTD